MGDNLPVVDLGTGKSAVTLNRTWEGTYAILQGGEVKGWGRNWEGQLGLGDTNHRGDNPGEMGDNLPVVDLGTGAMVTAIDVVSEHVCALLQGGRVKYWGRSPSTEVAAASATTSPS